MRMSGRICRYETELVFCLTSWTHLYGFFSPSISISSMIKIYISVMAIIILQVAWTNIMIMRI